MNDTPSLPLLVRAKDDKGVHPTHWRNAAVTWSWLVERFSTPRTEQKHINGYVAGRFEPGHPGRACPCLEKTHRLRASCTMSYWMLRLDADSAKADLPLEIGMLGAEAFVHETWSHTLDEPRYRVLLPLSREVDENEYWLIAKALMAELGVEQFDKGSAEAERVMYGPSCPPERAGGFGHWAFTGQPLDVEEWLERAAELGIEPRGAAVSVRGSADVVEWTKEHGDGEPCPYLRGVLDKALKAVSAAKVGDRYPSMRVGQLQLVSLAEQGHPGLLEALEQLKKTWQDQYRASEDGGSDESWNGALVGAVAIVTGSPTPQAEQGCDCSAGDSPLDDFTVLRAESKNLRWFPEGNFVRVKVNLPSYNDEANLLGNRLVKANESCEVPCLYRVKASPNNQLVYVTRDDESGETEIIAVGSAQMKAMLGAVGQRYAKNEHGNLKPTKEMPADVVTQVVLMLLGDSRVPVLERVICSPVLLPDGTWADHDSYDPVTRTLTSLRRDVGYRMVRGRPTSEQVNAAVARTKRAYAEVCFADAGGLAGPIGHAVGIAAAPYVKKLPLLRVTSGRDAQASGKTTLVRIAQAQSVHHSEVHVVPSADAQEGEVEKRIDTALTSHRRVKVLGNVPGGMTVDSSSLAEVLTADELGVMIRTYGRNDAERHASAGQAWSLTSNGCELSLDLTRRCWITVLNTGMEDNTSKSWVQRDIEKTLMREHEEMNYALRVLITEALARLDEGGEYAARVDAVAQTTVRGDFYQWCRLTKAVCDLLGVEKFGEDQEEMREQHAEFKAADPETEKLALLLGVLANKEPMTCGEILEVLPAQEGEDGPEDRWTGGTRGLGKWLASNKLGFASGADGRRWQLQSAGKRKWTAVPEAKK